MSEYAALLALLFLALHPLQRIIQGFPYKLLGSFVSLKGDLCAFNLRVCLVFLDLSRLRTKLTSFSYAW